MGEDGLKDFNSAYVLLYALQPRRVHESEMRLGVYSVRFQGSRVGSRDAATRLEQG